MTMIMIVFLWAAQALVEYKVIDAAPQWIRTIFHHKIGGIILSVLIGAAVAFALGIPNGFIVGAANFIGLATNNVTYPAIKATSRRAAQTKEAITTFKVEHPTVVTNFKAGLIGIAKIMGAFIVVIGFVFRLIGGIAAFITHPVQFTKTHLLSH